MSFNGNDIQTPESWSKHIGELGGILATMDREGIGSAKQIRDEVLDYWTIEEANLNRRTKILNTEDLDELNRDIGRSVGMQFLHLLTPDLDEDSKKTVAMAYGFAIKLADKVDAIVICSGDGDFYPLLEYLKGVKGCLVEVMSFRETTSSHLLEIVDDYTDLSKDPKRYLMKAGEIGRGGGDEEWKQIRESADTRFESRRAGRR